MCEERGARAARPGAATRRAVAQRAARVPAIRSRPVALRRSPRAATEHQSAHGGMDHSFRDGGQPLGVPAQAAAPPEPRERALHEPPSRKYSERAGGLVVVPGTRAARAGARGAAPPRPATRAPRAATPRTSRCSPGRPTRGPSAAARAARPGPRADARPAGRTRRPLHVGRVHAHGEQQAERVDEDVALPAVQPLHLGGGRSGASSAHSASARSDGSGGRTRVSGSNRGRRAARVTRATSAVWRFDTVSGRRPA